MLRWMSTVERLMPELAGAGPRTRAAVTVAVVAMPAALAGEVALTASGRAAGSSALAYAVVMTVGFISMMTVLALRAAMPSSDRRVWIALTAAVGMWMAGTVWESTIGHADGAAIGPADALWLSFYPLAYLAVVLRGRNTMRLARILRVDGLVSVLSVGAVAWLLVVDPIIASARLTHAETAVNTAYVTGDLGVMGLVVGVLGLHGWRAGRGWTMLAAGLAVVATGDSIYLLQLGAGTYVEATPLGVLWAAALLPSALAACQPPTVNPPAPPTLAVLPPPFAFGL